jgi:hypothetical protein
VVTGRMLEQLTYAQIGERLNVSSEGARAIVKRNRLPRSHGNDGRTLVAIDLDELRHKPMPARSPRGQPMTDVVAALRIEQLEAELAAEQQRPRRNALTMCMNWPGDSMLRNPITGITGLLRARRERPRHRCAGDKRDEFAALHAEHGDFLPCHDAGFTARSACHGPASNSLG